MNIEASHIKHFIDFHKCIRQWFVADKCRILRTINDKLVLCSKEAEVSHDVNIGIIHQNSIAPLPAKVGARSAIFNIPTQQIAVGSIDHTYPSGLNYHRHKINFLPKWETVSVNYVKST